MAKAKDKPHKFLLRVSKQTFEAVAGLAEREHRTLNAQIEYILERWLEQNRSAR